MQDNTIVDAQGRAFVAALRRFEQDPDPTELAGMFADDATLMRLDGRGERGDPTAFWLEYRRQFHELSTTFFNAVEGPEQIALEWRTEATLVDDRSISYLGVTVLDVDGQKINRLRTYYDTAAFSTVDARTG